MNGTMGDMVDHLGTTCNRDEVTPLENGRGTRCSPLVAFNVSKVPRDVDVHFCEASWVQKLASALAG
jgi:hypothetical protein